MNYSKYLDIAMNKIQSVKDFINKIDDLPIASKDLFRGQKNSAWGLVPSIARCIIENPLGDYWHGIETEMLVEFKNSVIPYKNVDGLNILELISFAQHHGIPTRLLDWSNNPLVALYFAVQDETKTSDGSVWILTSAPWISVLPTNYEDLKNRYLHPKDHLTVYRPKKIAKRIIAQNGAFTIHNLPKGNGELKAITESSITTPGTNLFKIDIDKEHKQRITWELDKLGINSSSLFPDLDGLSSYIKWKSKRNSLNFHYNVFYDRIPI